MKKQMLHEKQEFASVRDLVERAAQMYHDRVAYSFRNNPHDKEVVKKTFTELRDDVRALATEFLSRGLAGKHCSVIGKFSYSWVRMYFALLSIGAVIVPLDKDWLAADLADTAKRAEVSISSLTVSSRKRRRLLRRLAQQSLPFICRVTRGRLLNLLLRQVRKSLPLLRMSISMHR